MSIVLKIFLLLIFIHFQKKIKFSEQNAREKYRRKFIKNSICAHHEFEHHESMLTK